jgi:hypothetical protein
MRGACHADGAIKLLKCNHNFCGVDRAEGRAKHRLPGFRQELPVPFTGH